MPYELNFRECALEKAEVAVGRSRIEKGQLLHCGLCHCNGNYHPRVGINRPKVLQWRKLKKEYKLLRSPKRNYATL